MMMDEITRDMNELRMQLEEIKLPGKDGELVSVNKHVKDEIDRNKEVIYNEHVSEIVAPSDRHLEYLEEDMLLEIEDVTLEIEELKQKLEALESVSSPKEAYANIMKGRSLAYEGPYTMYATSYVEGKVVEFLEKERLQFITLELGRLGPTLTINIKNPYWKYYDNLYKENMNYIILNTEETNEIYLDNLVEMRKDDYHDSKLELERLLIELKKTEKQIENFPKRTFIANIMLIDEDMTHERYKMLKYNISFEAKRIEKAYERIQERAVDEEFLIREELTKALNFAKDILEYPINIM